MFGPSLVRFLKNYNGLKNSVDSVFNLCKDFLTEVGKFLFIHSHLDWGLVS